MWDFKVNVWNILIAIMGSGITAYLLSKFVVGKKVDRVHSFWEEEDRQKTKEAIKELRNYKQILESEDVEPHLLARCYFSLQKYDVYKSSKVYFYIFNWV